MHQQQHKWTEAWRLFEADENGPKTLFHAYNGSRVLPMGIPMRAKQGIVSNPGKKQYKFRAGWHVALSFRDAVLYLERFTADRELIVCRVLVRDFRPKPRSTAPVFLAKDMMVLEKDWKQHGDLNAPPRISVS